MQANDLEASLEHSFRIARRTFRLLAAIVVILGAGSTILVTQIDRPLDDAFVRNAYQVIVAAYAVGLAVAGYIMRRTFRTRMPTQLRGEAALLPIPVYQLKTSDFLAAAFFAAIAVLGALTLFLTGLPWAAVPMWLAGLVLLYRFRPDRAAWDAHVSAAPTTRTFAGCDAC